MWIADFRGAATPQGDELDALQGTEPMVVAPIPLGVQPFPNAFAALSRAASASDRAAS